MSHTPIPWKFGGAFGSGGLIVGPAGESIAVVYGESANADYIDNSLLIISAGELLRAAKAVAEYAKITGRIPHKSLAMDNLNAAITLAEEGLL